MFEGLKARLERILADHTVPGEPRQRAALLHSALVEAKVAVAAMRDALTATERQLASERKQLEDAERRGRLAAQIPDPETVQVAEQFAVRHRERVSILDKKLEVQREELALTQREIDQMTAELKQLRTTGTPAGGTTAAQEAAWRDLESAGGVRPDTDVDGDLLKHQISRQQMDAAVEAQLEHLKKKLGKERE
ncbi:MAG TPA: hypothetical protein VLD58_12115 [Gemmatimonadales bacterium]|nr:hypothetical protein [Gemmatimonadales bacterium]